MKTLLFLSLCKYETIEERDIYTDLLREFVKFGYYVVIASPLEKKFKQKPICIKKEKYEICQILINDYFNVKAIKKGISLLTIDNRFKNLLKKRYKSVCFDLILYATPPIMFNKTISYFKKRNAKTYLMLKDIYPQNAIDLGLLKTNGLKGIIYKFFRKKEKKLYSISDYIGCMSPANVDYVISKNPEIEKNRIEICPNCVSPLYSNYSNEEKEQIRRKYGIPLDKKVFVYGGNLGKPQSVPFIIECLKREKRNEDIFFLIIGNGTEFTILNDYYLNGNQLNFKLLNRVSTDEFDMILSVCDVGLIFLDYRFTIPNFPSRILSYMQAGLPIIAATDEISDIGKVILRGEFGLWCKSVDPSYFSKLIEEILKKDIHKMGYNARKYLEENYTSEKVFHIINNHLGE